MSSYINDGYIELAAEILRSACRDYETALKTIMELREEYDKVVNIVKEWDDYIFLEKEVKQIRYKKKKAFKELLLMEQYKLLTKPKKPSEKALNTVLEYNKAVIDKNQIEMFYKSSKFSNLTLQNRDVDGADIIAKIKHSVGWSDKYDSRT